MGVCSSNSSKDMHDEHMVDRPQCARGFPHASEQNVFDALIKRGILNFIAPCVA